MLSLHPLADHLYDLVATRSLPRYSDSFSEKYFVVITTFLEEIYLKSCWLSLCWKEYTRWYIQSLHVIPAEFESSQEINLAVFLPKWGLRTYLNPGQKHCFFIYLFFLWTRRFRKIVQLVKCVAEGPVCIKISTWGNSVVRVASKSTKSVIHVHPHEHKCALISEKCIHRWGLQICLGKFHAIIF